MFLKIWQWIIRLTGTLVEYHGQGSDGRTWINRWFESALGEYFSGSAELLPNGSLVFHYADDFRFPIKPGWVISKQTVR